jgi:starch phosphorylase
VSALFDRYIGRCWRVAPQEPLAWSGIARIDHAALWDARTAQRNRLLARVHTTLDSPLVIGFARRFATYKRAALLLQDPQRLAALLTDSERPVVLVFAGKAHPHDEPGKLLLQRIVEASRDARFHGRIAFVGDYDVELARLLVQGSDIWLNTPRRPMEASGTSGMKATLNGALHVSELDGWWDEAYAPGLGWALGKGIPDEARDEVRDAAEASQLMTLLENEVVPLFFNRDAQAKPSEWLLRVQRSIETLAGVFSAHRMVEEYVDRIYRPLAGRDSLPLLHLDDRRVEAAAA